MNSNKYFLLAFILSYICFMPAHSQRSGFDAEYFQRMTSEKIILLVHTCETILPTDSLSYQKYYDTVSYFAFNSDNSFFSAKAFHAMGLLYLGQNKYDSAQISFNKAISLLENSEKKEYKKAYALILTDMSMISIQLGDFDNALALLLEAEPVLLESDDYLGIKKNYSRIGNCYIQLEQEEKSYMYSKKNLKLATKINNAETKAGCFVDYANSMIYQKKFDSAAYYYQIALSEVSIGKYPLMKSKIYYNMAFMYSNLEDYETAHINYRRSYEEAKVAGNFFDMADALYKCGLVLYYSEKFEDAITALDSALILANKINSFILRRNIYDVLTYLEYERGNFKSAWQYQSNYIEEADKVNSEQSVKQINYLEVKFETQKKETEIKYLNQVKSKHQRILKLMTLVILLILALAGLAIKLIRDKKTIAEQRFLLEQEKVEKLKKESILIATQAVLSGEEIERRRLARDLHDGLGGMLSGIKLKLSNIKGTFVLDKESAKNFDNAIQGLDASVKEMRRVAHNLMPEVLVKYGLKEAINDFCSEFDASANKKLKFRFYGIPQRIDQNKEIGVYRIMQELVNNAIKHAEAGNILVQLVQETYRLSLTVQDNGKGFNVKIIDECKSVGLNSIKTRVKSLNGILDINSTPGKGTEIEVEFNL